MQTKKSRKLLALENYPISLELVRYTDIGKIPIARIAAKFNVSVPRVVALLGALIRSTETWQRLADHYLLTDADRPSWVGKGSTATYQHTEQLPPPIPSSSQAGQPNARPLARSHASMQGTQPGRVEAVLGYTLPQRRTQRGA